MTITILTKKAILKSNEINDFPNTKCVLTISVGQPNHEGDKFLATILATRKQFSYCIIMVCDSLQRYTMQISSLLSPDEVYDEANSLGAEWIIRNNLAIMQLKIPHQISRWDYWINHPDYKEKRHIIDSLYETNLCFRNSILNTTQEFLERNRSKIVVRMDDAYNLSMTYLLEECAVMLLLADEGYEFEIYPGQRNDAMDYVYQHIIATENRELMRAVSIKFKNLATSDQGLISTF